MRHPLSATGTVTPQPPGRTPHKAPQAPLRRLRAVLSGLGVEYVDYQTYLEAAQ